MAWRYHELRANNRQSAIKKFRRKLARDEEVMGEKFSCHVTGRRGKVSTYACNTYAHKRRK